MLRNGVGKLDLGVDQLQHWFDGPSLLQRFSFGKGKVSYRCRFLHSPPTWRLRRTAGCTTARCSPTPVPDILRGEQAEFVQEGVNANITFTRVNEAVIALCDRPMGIEIDPVTLETQELHDLKTGERKPGLVLAPAHLQRDYDRGLEYTVHTYFGPHPTYDIVVTDVASGKKSVLGSIPVQGRPSTRHHFPLTENYVVLLQYPLGTDPPRPRRWPPETYRRERPGPGTRRRRSRSTSSTATTAAWCASWSATPCTRSITPTRTNRATP